MLGYFKCCFTSYSPKEIKLKATEFCFAAKEDAEDVALALEGVWPRWYEIGAGLKILTSTLDQISGSAEEQMIVRSYYSVSLHALMVYTHFPVNCNEVQSLRNFLLLYSETSK